MPSGLPPGPATALEKHKEKLRQTARKPRSVYVTMTSLRRRKQGGTTQAGIIYNYYYICNINYYLILLFYLSSLVTLLIPHTPSQKKAGRRMRHLCRAYGARGW